MVVGRVRMEERRRERVRLMRREEERREVVRVGSKSDGREEVLSAVSLYWNGRL